MTQEIIDKLHEFEGKREKWVRFKSALKKGKNLAVYDYSITPSQTVITLGSQSLENWDEFQNYVMEYVDSMINMYDEEIAEL